LEGMTQTARGGEFLQRQDRVPKDKGVQPKVQKRRRWRVATSVGFSAGKGGVTQKKETERGKKGSRRMKIGGGSRGEEIANCS